MNQSNKKTILVTGALGHIGSQFIRSCSPVVGKIIIIDNLSTQRYASLFGLPKSIQYKFYEDDIRTADFAKYLQAVDAVIHFAAITDAPSSKDNPEETFAVNLEGTKRLADACAAAQVPLFFPSTTSLYTTKEATVDETSTEIEGQSPYAKSKMEAEQYIKKLASQGLRATICRFGTIFGPSIGMRFHTAVNKFTWQAVLGLPITVWKTAWQQKRPYLALEDCIQAINLIIEKDLFSGEIYNVVTINATVEDIVTTIKELIPNLNIQYVDSAIMNQLSYEVSDAKLKALGYAPTGNLRESIKATIERLPSTYES